MRAADREVSKALERQDQFLCFCCIPKTFGMCWKRNFWCLEQLISKRLARGSCSQKHFESHDKTPKDSRLWHHCQPPQGRDNIMIIWCPKTLRKEIYRPYNKMQTAQQQKESKARLDFAKCEWMNEWEKLGGFRLAKSVTRPLPNRSCISTPEEETERQNNQKQSIVLHFVPSKKKVVRQKLYINFSGVIFTYFGTWKEPTSCLLMILTQNMTPWPPCWLWSLGGTWWPSNNHKLFESSWPPGVAQH